MYKNILVYSLVNIGDVLLTTSAIALLKKAYPASKITMMVRPAAREIVENNPLIDDVIVYDYKGKEKSFWQQVKFVFNLKRRNFDLSISFDRKFRPALVNWLAGIPKRVGPSRVFDDKPSRVTMFYNEVISIQHELMNTLQAETYQEIIRIFTGYSGHEKPVMATPQNANGQKAEYLIKLLPKSQLKIALCVKGTFPLKTWTKEYFAKVVCELNKKYDASFFIIGAPSDKNYVDEVIAACNIPIKNFCEQTTLLDLPALLKRTDFLLTVDTGATHIAATTGIKMVVVYGCTSYKRWQPMNENVLVATVDAECSPCSISAEECEKPKCLWTLTPEMIIQKCNELLDR